MPARNLRLPNSIDSHLKEIATMEGVSINQLITTAVSEKVSALMTEDYLRERAARANNQQFLDILDNVPSRKPLEGDEL